MRHLCYLSLMFSILKRRSAVVGTFYLMVFITFSVAKYSLLVGNIDLLLVFSFVIFLDSSFEHFTNFNDSLISGKLGLYFYLRRLVFDSIVYFYSSTFLLLFFKLASLFFFGTTFSSILVSLSLSAAWFYFF